MNRFKPLCRGIQLQQNGQEYVQSSNEEWRLAKNFMFTEVKFITCLYKNNLQSCSRDSFWQHGQEQIAKNSSQ